MAKVESFEDLWIWQEARVLVREIYSDFGPETPAGHDYGFRGQIQTAGISIMNNIAEGFERHTDAEKARFLDIAKGIGYVCAELARQRREKAANISKGIATLSSHFRT